MKKLMKHSVSLVLIVIMCICMTASAFAMSGEMVPQCETITPNIGEGLDQDIFCDVLTDVTMRTDIKPEFKTSLPYEAKGSIRSYTYTNYVFHPSGDGEIYTRFNGSLSSGKCTVTLKLYDNTAGAVYQTSYNLGEASSWTNKTTRWYNLDPTHCYYFLIEKTGSSTLTFTMNINKTNSF